MNTTQTTLVPPLPRGENGSVGVMVTDQVPLHPTPLRDGEGKQSRKGMWCKVLLSVLLLVLCGGAAAGGYTYYHGHQLPPHYTTVAIERGDLTTTVNATGTVNAVVSVQVGTQVSGTIQKLFADFNSTVQEGDMIAQIDPAPLETKVLQARANLTSATAAVQVAHATVESAKAAIDTARAKAESAKANIEKSKVALDDARRTLERKRALFQRALIPQNELDSAQTAYDSTVSQLQQATAQYDATVGQLKSAVAQARLAEAQLSAALAQVEQSKAALQAADLDLQHTTIRSPVNGIVIARNVDVGQTVAASLQAPILFLIARDLTHMQVDTNVSEADIGRIIVGQTATFTVDAHAGTTFKGQVVQVRNAPITVQNVVTYNAVVQVANPELKLKPGMTANVAFLVAERNNILKIPNAALRFQPDGAKQEASGQESKDTQGGSKGPLQEMQERLTQAVTLSADHQTRLEAIMQQAKLRYKALREEASDDRRRALRRELLTQLQGQMRDILTPEQRLQYEASLKTREGQAPAGRPGRVAILGPLGTPELYALTLGITNDTHTEVISGDVTVGQQVITGIVAPAKPTPAAPPPGFSGSGRMRGL